MNQFEKEQLNEIKSKYGGKYRNFYIKTKKI